MKNYSYEGSFCDELTLTKCKIVKEIVVTVYRTDIGLNILEDDFLEQWLMFRLNYTNREHKMVIRTLYDNIVGSSDYCITAIVTIDGKTTLKYQACQFFDNFVSFYLNDKLIGCKGVRE